LLLYLQISAAIQTQIAISPAETELFCGLFCRQMQDVDFLQFKNVSKMRNVRIRRGSNEFLMASGFCGVKNDGVQRRTNKFLG